MSPRIVKKNQKTKRREAMKLKITRKKRRGKETGTLKRLLLSLWHINSITVGRNRETINVI